MNGFGGRRACPLGVVVAVVVSGCAAGAGGATARPPAPAPAPVVEVRMVEHRFELDSPVPAGRVVFRLTNAGEEVHNVLMLPLPEDVPPILEQLRGKNRRLVQPYAGFYDREPGDVGTFAVDLLPGQRYAMVCLATGKDGKPHWDKGMATEFRTPGEPIKS